MLNIGSGSKELQPTDEALRVSAEYLSSASKVIQEELDKWRLTFSQLRELYFKQLEEESDLRVKLILSSIAIRKGNSSHISRFKKDGAVYMDMTMMLQIGPVVLDWNNTSLIVGSLISFV